MKYFYLIFLITFLNLVYSQSFEEKRCSEYYYKGEALYKAKDYTGARQEFEKSFILKMNNFSAPCLFMSGLCCLNEKNYNIAILRFQDLINKFPQSTLKDEATYHKALAMLEKTESRDGGLYLLLTLYENSKDEILKKDSYNAAKQFLYDATVFYLELYLNDCKKSIKSTVYEALCYKHFLNKDYDKVKKTISAAKKDAVDITPILKKFVNAIAISENGSGSNSTSNTKKTINIAVVLPFMTQLAQDSSLNGISKISLEFMEGILDASSKLSTSYPINIQFWDSQKDSNRINNLIIKDLNKFHPDLIIGEIFNSQSQVLTEYSEKNKILHLIPFSQSQTLTDNKKNVYLANPSYRTQAEGLGKFSKSKSESKKIMIIEEDSPVFNECAEIFKKNNPNASITIKKISSNITAGLSEMPKLVNEFVGLKYDGIFLATNKQDYYANFLQNTSKGDSTNYNLFAFSDLKDFNKVSMEFYFWTKAAFITNSDDENDISLSEAVDNQCFSKYNYYPNNFYYQGYDIIRFSIQQLQNNIENDAFKKMKAFKGINQNYFFGNSQSNMSLQFIQYKDFKINKVTLW